MGESAAGLLVLAGKGGALCRGRFARHDLAAAIVSNTRAGAACVALELLLGGSVVNHGAHVIIDRNEFVDPCAASVTRARIAARTKQVNRSACWVQIQ